ncbi:MAG: SpoIID/LytB domain-containing protein [Lachnotalea sp.]
MKKFYKNIISIIIIILLLPYVITTTFKGGINFAKEDNTVSTKTVLVYDNKVKLNLDIEQYIIGVVASQIPIYYEKEAMKAQAVIARTSVIKKIGNRESINTSEMNLGYMNMVQMEEYWGYDRFFEYYNMLEEIVNGTKGEVLEYEGNPIEAAFHAVSIGTTRSGASAMNNDDYPYLTSVKSEKDVESEDYMTTITTSFEKISDIFQDNITELPEIISSDELGYVEKIKINNQIISGEKFRKKLSLPSACFEMKLVSGAIKITVIGKGHGLGLSQYGANEMAKEGKNYIDILNYYYQNINIVNE